MRMHADIVWLAVALLSFPLFTLCDPLNVMIAPNLLRVGTPEKVFVEVQDHTGDDIPVKISMTNFPQKSIEMVNQNVVLTAAKHFQALVYIKIPDKKDYFSEDPLEKQYVYLQAQFPTSVLEKVVMVSFQSGYIFVQTDKSIYTPGTPVHYRLFSLSPDLQPVDQSGITVEIINNQGIPISEHTYYPKQGTITGKYNIPDIAIPGIWSVVARYKNTPQKNFSSEFEVKEYVLPSFEVTLTPSESFFYVDDEELTVDISAKYLFGKKVDGEAFVVFGVMKDDRKTALLASLRREKIEEGEGKATLTRDMIVQTFPNIHQLIGSSLYISWIYRDPGCLMVVHSNPKWPKSSEMVEAQRRGIQIVTSPYTIHFKRTPKFFKPGMPFDVTVYVTNPDQTPAANVEVEVSPGAVRVRTKSNGMAKVVINTKAGVSTLPIEVRTTHPHISYERQARNNMTVQAYETKGGTSNYLHISIDSAELAIGEQMNLKLFLTGQIQNQDLTYLILSKGQIVLAKRHKGPGKSLVALSETVSKNLVPSFRVVAYYNLGASEVVADSIWVDVKDTCMGTLELSLTQPKATFLPGGKFNLKVTGDPGAKVGLVAVDKAVVVLNKNRLTQNKVWDIIEKHDTGCTAGSGKNNMGVFSDAGLMFDSDKAGGTELRTDKECPKAPKRKRRAESLLQITQTLTQKYSGELKKCCADGLKDNKMGYTCERRATFILDGAECIKAFLHCCNEMKTRRKDQRETELILARTDEDDDNYISSDEIVTRSQFPESWMWHDIELPTCPRNKSCETTSLTMKDNYMKDSLTTWQILAISLSKTHGICVADPFEMVVVKDFFVDLKLPYSAVRNEQIEIKAVLHNYSNQKQKVRVDFLKTNRICSAASQKGTYRTIVEVDSMSTRSVPYVIIPMDTGDYQIEVQAASSSYEDGIKKTLKVVSEGILKEVVVKNIEINPSKHPDGTQFVQVRSEIPADLVPATLDTTNTHITVTGQELSQTIEQAISGNFMGRLIVQPLGCGEQNMIFMTLPLIAVHYLDNTNQWDGVGVQRRAEAVQHIKTGYERELMYRKTDGSYAAFTHHSSSTWLTAYVAKVFALASDIVSIKEEDLCSALKWLVLNRQMPDGMFNENGPVIHGDMVGNVQGKDSDASLTAFVLIAMQEGSHLCAKSFNSLPDTMTKAIHYLERRLPSLKNPYAVVMTSYAMANAGRFKKELLMKHSSDDTFWQVPGNHYFTLEATAYALLALVKAKEYNAAGKAVKWLNRQSSPYGGHGTTQATIMVFQAVAEYYKQVKKSPNLDLDVEVVVSGRSVPIRWTFSKSNAHVTRSDKVKIMERFNVTAKGTGAGTLKVMTLYYAMPTEKPGDCKDFSLSVNMEREHDETEDQQTYLLTIEYLYKDSSKDATMTILDIGMLTGFVVDQGDLVELSTGKERYFQKFDLDKQLSERRSLIIYLDNVTHSSPEKIAFRVHKLHKVAMLQPAAVTVYEYYSPDKRCMKYYHPVKKDGALNRLCSEQEGLCQCAEENCSIQKKFNIKENERDTKACERGIDYVYKVRVVKIVPSQTTDLYTMKIEEVIKEGTDPGVQDQERVFLGHANCREYFNLTEGKTYLIMGRGFDLPKIKDRVQYVLGEETWIEYWPTSEESQTNEHRDKYNDISRFAKNLTDIGCTT